MVSLLIWVNLPVYFGTTMCFLPVGLFFLSEMNVNEWDVYFITVLWQKKKMFYCNFYHSFVWLWRLPLIDISIDVFACLSGSMWNFNYRIRMPTSAARSGYRVLPLTNTVDRPGVSIWWKGRPVVPNFGRDLWLCGISESHRDLWLSPQLTLSSDQSEPLLEEVLRPIREEMTLLLTSVPLSTDCAAYLYWFCSLVWI